MPGTIYPHENLSQNMQNIPLRKILLFNIISNCKKSRRIPILGKHKKRVLCGAWSADGLLALASEDKVLTISTSEGDTRREIALQGDPSHIQFSEMKMDHRIGGENTV